MVETLKKGNAEFGQKANFDFQSSNDNTHKKSKSGGDVLEAEYRVLSKE